MINRFGLGSATSSLCREVSLMHVHGDIMFGLLMDSLIPDYYCSVELIARNLTDAYAYVPSLLRYLAH